MLKIEPEHKEIVKW